MTYPDKHVKVSRPSQDVLVLSLARPKANALNDALWQEIKTSFEVASEDVDVRVVVFASALDRFWTAGLDLAETTITEMQSSDAARSAMLLRQHIKHLQSCVSAIQECSKPVIAALHGFALGGAIDLAAACDVRFAAEDVIFSVKEVDIGLAADVGSLQRLPKVTGNESLLRELAFTGRNFGASEAKDLGLVSRVVKGGRQEVYDAALGLAKVIASKSPVAVVGTKHLLNYSREHTVAEGLDYTSVWNGAMLQTEDLTSSFAAFSTKKPPTYNKLGKL